MAVIGWGKPNIYIKDLGATTPTWEKLPDPVLDSTTLETTKGDKTEAKVEGGENEDVRYNRNTYVLNLALRAAKNRARPVTDDDGVVTHNYAIVVQPEDAEVQGLAIEKATVSVEDTWSTAEGGQWAYAFDALKPATGAQVKWGVIDVTTSGTTITKIEITPTGGTKTEVAPNIGYVEGEVT